MTPAFQVFVYGTLKPGESNYSCYCEGKTLATQPAFVWGRLFQLPVGYPALAPGTDKVQGVLLSFRDEAALQKLDALEDYEPDRPPEQNEYQRVTIEVLNPDGSPLATAWIYQMTEEKIQSKGGIWLPTGQWTGQQT